MKVCKLFLEILTRNQHPASKKSTRYFKFQNKLPFLQLRAKCTWRLNNIEGQGADPLLSSKL